jgi:hypothetical protein
MIAEPINIDTEAPQFPDVTGRCPWYSCLFGVWKTLSFALTTYFKRDHAYLETHLADFLSALRPGRDAFGRHPNELDRLRPELTGFPAVAY